MTRSQYGVRTAPPSERVHVHLKLHLESGLLFDVRTGQVLWQLHPDDVVPIASLTKMMTALIVLAHSRTSDHVLITPAAVHFSGSGIGLLPVHKRVPELALLFSRATKSRPYRSARPLACSGVPWRIHPIRQRPDRSSAKSGPPPNHPK